MQAPGWLLHHAIQNIPYSDIDRQLRLIQLERREIGLQAQKKQLQNQADWDILNISPTPLLPLSSDTQPWGLVTCDPVQTESNGAMNQDALSSGFVLKNIHPEGQGISRTVVQPAISSLDSEITCLPPSWFSLESNDLFPLAPSNEQNTLSAEPVTGKVIELSEEDITRSTSSQALRPASTFLLDKNPEPRIQRLRPTVIERTRKKKKRPEIPGTLCFYLNNETGCLARTKQVQSKEALERSKVIRKLGACLYCRYLKKPVRYRIKYLRFPSCANKEIVF